jgi:hypothetical protein
MTDINDLTSDQTPLDADLNSLFGSDLTNVPTDAPLVKPGMYEVHVSKISVDDNKARTGKNMNIELAYNDSVETEDGRSLNPGFKLFHVISLVPTEKYDPRQNLAAFKICFTGRKDGGFGDPQQYVGLNGVVNVQIDRSNPAYPAKNVVKRFLKPATPADTGSGQEPF